MNTPPWRREESPVPWDDFDDDMSNAPTREATPAVQEGRGERAVVERMEPISEQNDEQEPAREEQELARGEQEPARQEQERAPISAPRGPRKKVRTHQSLRDIESVFPRPNNIPRNREQTPHIEANLQRNTPRPVTRRVCSANYSAVCKTPKLGFIDMGREFSGRTLLAHGDSATDIRQGSRLNLRQVGSKKKDETSVEILYVTRSGYYAPGHRVRTSLVGVSDRDWGRVFKRHDA